MSELRDTDVNITEEERALMQEPLIEEEIELEQTVVEDNAVQEPQVEEKEAESTDSENVVAEAETEETTEEAKPEDLIVETDAAETVEVKPEEEPEEQTPEVTDTYIPPQQIDAPDIEALNAKSEELAKKLEAYEITPQEYQKQVAEIQSTINKYETQVEISNAIEQAEWKSAQKMFFADNPEYWSDPIKHATLKAVLEVLYQSDANLQKSNEWFLSEAKRQIDSTYAQKQEPVAQTKPKETPPKPAQATKKPDVPVTLAAVPPAAQEATGDRYSALDSASGLDAEAAYANLSAEDQERFLMAGMGE